MHEKIEIGQILSRIFQFYGQQVGLLLPAALIVFLPVTILNLAITEGDPDGGGAYLLAALSAAISVVATFWYQGMVVEAVRDILDGVRDFSLGQLFRSVTPVLGTLILAGILAGIGIGIGFVLLIVPGLLLLTWWALLAPIIVVERAGVGEAFGRSRALVRGNGWRVFGVIVLLGILQAFVSGVFGAVASGLSDSSLVRGPAMLVGNALVAPLTALAASTMYFELKRIRAGSEGATAEPNPA